MNGVLFVGFHELPPEDQSAFVKHVMDKSHWARASKKKMEAAAQASSAVVVAAPKADQDSAGETKVPAAATAVVPQKSSAVTTGKKKFVIPRPGKNGCKENVLQGETVVLTGIFPELGGGAALSLGKDRAKALVQSFGGRVTSSVSGKTTVLLVGKEPGFQKVSQARERGIRVRVDFLCFSHAVRFVETFTDMFLAYDTDDFSPRVEK